MTLNKKTIKSVCSHMSQSRPRWGAGSLASECPQKKKAIAAFAPCVRALQSPSLEREEIIQNGLRPSLM